MFHFITLHFPKFRVFSTIFIAFIFPQCSIQKSSPGLHYGGLSLSQGGKFYEISTKECPGGIFLTRPVNETCLCYHGIYSVVRDCCSKDTGIITTETLEWRTNFQCGMSPEIGSFGPKRAPIRAILPLTRANSPFKPVLTSIHYKGNNFTKWRKFDLSMLAAATKPQVFYESDMEIVNIRPHKKPIKFKMGKEGDVDICYEGWVPEGPQTLRISIFTSAKRHKNGHKYCCFKLAQHNVPGVIHSSCRKDTLLTEIVDIESVKKGNKCPKHSKKEKKRSKKKSTANFPSELLLRVKRSDDTADSDVISEDPLAPIEDDSIHGHHGTTHPHISASVTEPSASGHGHGGKQHPKADSESDASESEGEEEEEPATAPPPRYLITQLENDTLTKQHTNLRIFNIMRKKGFTEMNREATTQRFILLKKSFDLFNLIVPEEMFPKQMSDNAFESFFYLFEGYDVDEDRLSSKEMERVMGILEECKGVKSWSDSDELELNYGNGTCPSKVSSITTTMPDNNNGTNETVTEDIDVLLVMPPSTFQHDPPTNDMIVDIAWKMIDFVHTICFEKFHDDYNAHHLYENQMEILFLMKMVQQRWFRNTNFDGDYTRGIITHFHKMSRMVELDKALGIAHYIRPYHDFLHRPKREELLPMTEIYKRVKRYEEAVRNRLGILEDLESFENGELDIIDDVKPDPHHEEAKQEASEEAELLAHSGDVEAENTHHENKEDLNKEELWKEDKHVSDDSGHVEKSKAHNAENESGSSNNSETEIVEPEADVGEDVNRRKKHINSHKTQPQAIPPGRPVKPGDLIWDGLAICLDASSNDDPAYYSQEELWGTRPSLVELGKRYP